MILRTSVSASSLSCIRTPFQQQQGEVKRLPASNARVSRWRPSLIGVRIRAGISSNELSEEVPEPFGRAAQGSVQIDLQLPRRRLLVQFNCNVCKTTTQRLVNPEAYKRGTVYVQCAGCESFHQLVDNLGLVEEYDFRKEEPELTGDVDSSTI